MLPAEVVRSETDLKPYADLKAEEEVQCTFILPKISGYSCCQVRHISLLCVQYVNFC